MVVAFFDIDHTIICGTSMERAFLKYLFKSRYIKVSDILRTAVFICRHLFDSSGISIRSRRPYLQGKSVAVIESLAAQCFKKSILPLISRDAMETIRRHKKAGQQVVLLSGTPHILARLLSRHVNADYYIACKAVEAEGYFTGDILNPIPYGEGKRDILLSYATEKGINLKECFAYGDSIADIGVFRSVGNPYVVNPARRLRLIAAEKGWRIVYWRVDFSI